MDVLKIKFHKKKNSKCLCHQIESFLIDNEKLSKKTCSKISVCCGNTFMVLRHLCDTLYTNNVRICAGDKYGRYNIIIFMMIIINLRNMNYCIDRDAI